MAPASHVLEHRLLLFRRTWRGTLFNSFGAPILFLAAMGLGLGQYINQSGTAALGGVPYLVFLAPGLLAANAMQIASSEASFPVTSAIVWIRQFPGMLATPIGIRDIVMGQTAWFAIKVSLGATAFLFVTFLFGAVSSPTAILEIPAGILTGLAFAAPIAAFAATQKTGNGFSTLFRFGITPLFLFSGTFFPITQLPPPLQVFAALTPLYHGVALTRGVALGTLDPATALIHVAYLTVLAIAGTIAFRITLQRRLGR